MELQLWREMLTPYELAVDELVLKFRHIIREYRNVGRYSPIEQVDGRVKSISSILDKMQRKKINVNDVEKELEDIAGIRLICQFVEDIDRVLEIIESRSDMEIKSHKDYISHSKDSGYRSYHVIVGVPVYCLDGMEYFPVEIQFRTMSMDFWASMEHRISYKKERTDKEQLKEELREYANMLVEIERRFEQYNETDHLTESRKPAARSKTKKE